ncbi:MAG: 3D domain-containing protein [Gemmatimonadota bacterium]
MTVVVLLCAIGLTIVRIRAGLREGTPLLFAPTVVTATLQLEGALVLGASAEWANRRPVHLRYGDPVPVSVTAYCLRGRTRRDRWVREGIVASDPHVFPLARYIEIYVGRTYFGRFLVDDTGKDIKGNRLDVWTPMCSEARSFGRQRGTAVLVPRPKGAKKDTVLTGKLGGPNRPG